MNKFQNFNKYYCNYFIHYGCLEMLLLKQILMNNFFQLNRSDHKLIWKTKFIITKLIVKTYIFETDNSPAGLFPLPPRLEREKLVRPPAKTTSQQFKPLTHKNSDSKKSNKVKGGKDIQSVTSFNLNELFKCQKFVYML